MDQVGTWPFRQAGGSKGLPGAMGGLGALAALGRVEWEAQIRSLPLSTASCRNSHLHIAPGGEDSEGLEMDGDGDISEEIISLDSSLLGRLFGGNE